MQINATEIKQRLGFYMDKSQEGEPIEIIKNGRTYAILLSYKEFQRLLYIKSNVETNGKV